MANTPYDDAFRTLMVECPELMFPMINEVFGTHYTGKEELIIFQNEHFWQRQDGEEQKRITDTCFEVVKRDERRKFHWECQSTNDKTVTKRIFEYGSQIALENGKIVGDKLKVNYPAAAVLALRAGKSDPDTLRIQVGMSGGENSHEIQVMKMISYSSEEIFRKKLLFLIPFFIFNHEGEFPECEKEEGKLETLCQEYQMIWKRMNALCQSGEISEYMKCTLVAMSIRVLESIAANYEKVKKGVRKVMGGQILEYEARTIKNEGRLEGRREGRKEGRKEGENSMAHYMACLAEALLKAGRMEEFRKAGDDADFRNRLFAEFRIV